MISQRNLGLKIDQGLTINMDPEIAKIFQSSTAISSKHLYP